MKKILSVVFAMVLALSCFLILAGCGESSQGDSSTSQGDSSTSQGNQEAPPCEHNYVETQVEATCTEPGYNLFTCSKCQDSYKGENLTPVENHTGIGKCKVCGVEFDPIWKEFIDKNSGDDPNNRVVLEGLDTVVLTYSDSYDCLISVLSYISNGTLYQDDILTFAYNSYDKEWTWLYSTEFGPIGMPLEGEAGGRFSEWSSRSNSLNCDMRTGSCKNDSDLLSTIKKLYNTILDKANAKLQGCGYNITLANFGLSK